MANAIGIIEFTSVARGIFVTDQMLKASEVEIVTASSVCPGKYMAIVHGDVASVENAVEIGERASKEFWIDSIIIPNVSPLVFPAITGSTMPDEVQALGILETFSIATMVLAADAVLKASSLYPLELRLGTGLGGKSFFTFTGDVGAVEAGIEAGKKIIEEKGLLVNSEIIPSPSKNLLSSLF